MNKSLSLFIISVLLLTASYSQSGQDKEIIKNLDSLITPRFESIAPGCVILVVTKGTTLYKKAFGTANLELNVPMKPDMVFRIGSITKQYTGIAILQLIEQGRISLQDSIQKFIKDFPDRGHKITIENLLTHTSGIIDYQVLNFPVPNAIRIDFPAKQIIDSLNKLPLDFVPGSKFNYSNSNYFLLAYIIEQASGKSYKQYLTENIFKPANLSNTYYDEPETIIPNRVSGYAKKGLRNQNAGYISMTQVYGAGALLSNVEDMYKWHQALYAYKLVKKETLEKAFMPFKLLDGKLSEYSYGWFIKNRNDTKSIEHRGGIDGFQSEEIYFPEQDIFIAALYNSLNEGDDLAFMKLDNDIATLSAGKKIQPGMHIDTAVLKQYTGVYQADPKHPAIITLEDGELQMEAKAGGLPKSTLFAKSNNRFFLKVIDAEVEFVKDNNNKIIELIVYFKGQKQVAKKVK